MTLCVPSYQIPGTWLENVEFLSPETWIQGIELAFFSYDHDARRILGAERDRLAAYRNRFSFSLHLPDPFTERDLELVELTADFVELYVLHPFDQAKYAGSYREWREFARRAATRKDGARIALEYTNEANFSLCAADFSDFGVCADTGGLLRQARDPGMWIAERSNAISEIHLHAARGEKDHFALSASDTWLSGVAALAQKRDWRIVLETFSLEASRASYEEFIGRMRNE